MRLCVRSFRWSVDGQDVGLLDNCVEIGKRDALRGEHRARFDRISVDATEDSHTQKCPKLPNALANVARADHAQHLAGNQSTMQLMLRPVSSAY